MPIQLPRSKFLECALSQMFQTGKSSQGGASGTEHPEMPGHLAAEGKGGRGEEGLSSQSKRENTHWNKVSLVSVVCVRVCESVDKGTSCF